MARDPKPSGAFPSTNNLSTFIDRFIADQDISPASRTCYRRNLGQFMTWVEKTGAKSPDRKDILDYKRSLEGNGLSAATVHAYLVVVRRFFEWAESVRLYPNIARSIKGAKRTHGFKKDPLTVDQVKELLASIDRSFLQGKRDFAIINLLIRTGLRTIEVIRANVGDIRQASGEALLWIQGKGREGKDDFVLLTPDTLKPRVARGPVSDELPLFTSLSDPAWRGANE